MVWVLASRAKNHQTLKLLNSWERKQQSQQKLQWKGASSNEEKPWQEEHHWTYSGTAWIKMVTANPLKRQKLKKVWCPSRPWLGKEKEGNSWQWLKVRMKEKIARPLKSNLWRRIFPHTYLPSLKMKWKRSNSVWLTAAAVDEEGGLGSISLDGWLEQPKEYFFPFSFSFLFF